MIEWGKLLKLCRQTAGLTQREIAERVYCSPTLIVAYEQGKTSPKVDVADRILDVCGGEFGIRPKRTTYTAEEVMAAIKGADDE